MLLDSQGLAGRSGAQDSHRLAGSSGASRKQAGQVLLQSGVSRQVR